MIACVQCRKPIMHNGVYCSNQCQRDNEYASYILSWRAGNKSGNRGINTRNISAFVKRYLHAKYNNKCSQCGWGTVHPLTGNVPLEIDHIDGNAENNAEANLRLLCPNCHSLTPNFRNLNKGKGRNWRKVKYIKVT